ncbi:MAG: hypothetical protein M3P18_00705 [Actinomycetota bacterium]|nr:hypothetical protein [Actinomycetota bacterium]
MQGRTCQGPNVSEGTRDQYFGQEGSKKGPELQTITDAEIIVSSTGDPGRFALVFDWHLGAIRRCLDRRVGQEWQKTLL